MASIELTASSKRKTKEVIKIESLLPQDLRENSERLITLLEDYYRFMNLHDKDRYGLNPSYELSHISEERDIDTAEHYLDQIQKEIAASVPRNITTDRVKLYKNLVKYYNIRGSTDSIETFFKIFLNDNVEVYYPKNDMLIASGGKWDKDANRYLTNDGFLSDSKKLQDSYFYQNFSYVIRTGSNIDQWRDVFNKLVHPSGFIFFGEIFLYILALNDKAKMPLFQPGLISAEDVPVIVQMFAGMPPTSVAQFYIQLLLVFYAVGEVKKHRQQMFSDLLKFYDETPVGDYGQFTIQQGINKTIDRSNVGVSIIQAPY